MTKITPKIKNTKSLNQEDLTALLERKIKQQRDKLTVLYAELKEHKQNRIITCGNCDHKHIEKEVVLIKEMDSNYSSDDNPWYVKNKFIVCDGCKRFISAEGIDYYKSIEKYYPNQNGFGIPDRIKPELERQRKEYEEQNIIRIKKQELERAIKIINENGMKII